MRKKLKILVFSLIFALCILYIPSTCYAETFGSPLMEPWTKTSPIYDRTGHLGISAGWHAGWDMVPGGDQRIFVPAGGTVVKNSFDDGSGNYVVIKHTLGSDLIIDGVNYGTTIYTLYCHMASQSSLRQGQNVAKGDVIGVVGNTGNSTGVHLHFSIGSEATGGSFSSFKAVGSNTGKYPTGEEKHEEPVYGMLVSDSNPQKAVFSLDLIMGMDIDAPEVEVEPEDPYDETIEVPEVLEIQDEEEELEDSDKEAVIIGNPNIRHYSDGSTIISGATGIVDKEDIDVSYGLSGGVITYGTLDTLEDTTNVLQDLIYDYSKVFAVIFLFGGTLISGLKILEARGNGMKAREALFSGLGGVGVGALIVGCALELVQIISFFTYNFD